VVGLHKGVLNQSNDMKPVCHYHGVREKLLDETPIGCTEVNSLPPVVLRDWC